MILLKKHGIAIFLFLVSVFFFNTISINAIIFEGKIHKNIYVRDLDLSNLTKEEAINIINDEIYNRDSFYLNLNDKQYVFSKKNIDVDYGVKKLVDKAYEIGRDEDIVSNLKKKNDLSMGKKVKLDYEITYNDEKLNNYLDDLNNNIKSKPINATIKIKNQDISITKDKQGYELDKKKLKDLVVNKIENIENTNEIMPIKYIKPIYSYDELSKINTVLGSFETNFNVNNYNRSENIRLTANATSDILLNKGEIFSFNSIVKNADLEKSLKEAPVIVNGKQEKGIGGGMCQVSSTMYNAALYSGMKIINVRNHSIPSPYIEMGRDATVSLGCIDFRFTNTFDTPVFIHNNIIDNKMICTIYGNQEDNKEIEVKTQTVETLYNRSVRKNSDEYDLGVKNIEQEGRKGYKVKTYRIYKTKLGNKTECIGESYYPPQDKIIVYGTKDVDK